MENNISNFEVVDFDFPITKGENVLLKKFVHSRKDTLTKNINSFPNRYIHA
jgi:hypothetical protein